MKKKNQEVNKAKCEFFNDCKLNNKNFHLTEFELKSIRRNYCFSENHKECARHKTSHLIGSCNVPLFMEPIEYSFFETIVEGQTHSAGIIKKMKSWCEDKKKTNSIT